MHSSKYDLVYVGGGGGEGEGVIKGYVHDKLH